MAAVPVAASSFTAAAAATAQPSAILLQAAAAAASTSTSSSSSILFLRELGVERRRNHGASTSSTLPGARRPFAWAKASTYAYAYACTVNAGSSLEVHGDGGMRGRSCRFQRAPEFRIGEKNVSSRPTTKHPAAAGFRLRAKRKSTTGEGNAMIQEDNKDVKGGGGGDIDDDTRLGLNEISTEALKAMLSEDDNVVADLREKVEYIENYLIHEDQADAAKFMLVIKGMLDHEVILESDELKGSYKKAFDKIFSVVEDSGWVLKQAGADLGGVEMVDDELMPPVLNTQY